MESQEIRRRFLTFFEKRGHAIIPSASLVTTDEDGILNKTLFNSAGMQPLIPYLLGEEHPKGKRIANIQKCVRTGDIDDVGDYRHLTFFEMMGNWSLGDYFKKDAIKWSYEFLTSKKEGLGLDPKRLYVTIFEGDENTPIDEESKNIWLSLGISEHRIYPLGIEDNWWSAGDNGPSGPDTEMFYDMTDGEVGDLSKQEFIKAVQQEDLVEIWNDVFMEFLKKDGKIVRKLPQKNVDTGAGLDRMTAVMQGKRTPYDTDLFSSIINTIRKLSKKSDIRSERIVSDHIRAATFMISDGVLPSNTDRGYVLRRLIRRAVRYADDLGIELHQIGNIVDSVTDKYREIYDFGDEEYIREIILEEEDKFRKTLKSGIKELHKLMIGKAPNPLVLNMIKDTPLKPSDLTGRPTMEIFGSELFKIFTTYGFPLELSLEELSKVYNQIYNNPPEDNYDIRKSPLGKKLIDEFNEEMSKHQELSRAGAEQKFKGGLAGHSEMEVKYHTATHLLHQALRDVLGPEVMQKGSNITPERLRFDFAFPRKMTDEEKKRVEDIVNKKIAENLPVKNEIMKKDDAVSSGALHFFDQKYPDEVSVYSIGDYSKEFCGGPHVENTGTLGIFRIQKEEAVSAGVRRIKALLQ